MRKSNVSCNTSKHQSTRYVHYVETKINFPGNSGFYDHVFIQNHDGAGERSRFAILFPWRCRGLNRGEMASRFASWKCQAQDCISVLLLKILALGSLFVTMPDSNENGEIIWRLAHRNYHILAMVHTVLYLAGKEFACSK